MEERTAFVFPGQGSQSVGMGQRWYECYPVAVAEFYEQAEAALGFDIKKLIFNGPEAELSLTENAQPAILLDSIIKDHLLKAQGVRPEIALGHSLGEYSALVSAGVVSLEDGLRLVRKRGRLMQEAVPIEQGAMVAILGLAFDQVVEICEAVEGIAEVANYNSPTQIVISGNRDAVLEAANRAQEAGAIRTIELEVSAPFHCSLMAPAQAGLKRKIAAVKFRRPAFPVIMTVSGQLETESKVIKELLTRQITSPVRWVDYIERLRPEGIERTIEVGPGQVLTGLNRRITREMEHLRFSDAIKAKAS
ncbi:MAG: ACP S-malonyltransferase [Candidatus Bipolaricaulia bacterium]